MIKPLTSLRFLFALMVFVSHLGFVESNDAVLSWIYKVVLDEGYIGVSFFFVLSGFILTYRYQDDLLKNRTSRKAFFNARIARIVPLHLLTFVLAMPLSLNYFSESKLFWGLQALTNVTLTQSFFTDRHIYFSFNSPSWSISDEMFFYLLFPIIIFLIPKLKRYALAVIPMLILIIPLLSLIIPESYHHSLFYINPLFRLVDFCVGILLFMAFKSYKDKRFKLNFTLLELLGILLFVLFVALHDDIPQVARYSYYYWVPMCFIIFIFAFQKGNISKLLSHPKWIHLGHISFGFYLFHQLILRYVLRINSKFEIFESQGLIILIVLILTLLVSHFGFIWFEKPMNTWVKKHLKKIKL